MRFFCDIHDYQGRGKIFRKKNYDQSSNRVKHCCEKAFKPIWTVEGRQRGKSAGENINPVSEAGKHQPCCDWLKEWHVAISPIEDHSEV